MGADSLLLSEGRDSYRISDFLVDRPVADLGNIPNFGQQNVGLNLKAEIGQLVHKNELINGGIPSLARQVSETSALFIK
jgi:hypothetical protein